MVWSQGSGPLRIYCTQEPRGHKILSLSCIFRLISPSDPPWEIRHDIGEWHRKQWAGEPNSSFLSYSAHGPLGSHGECVQPPRPLGSTIRTIRLTLQEDWKFYLKQEPPLTEGCSMAWDATLRRPRRPSGTVWDWLWEHRTPMPCPLTSHRPTAFFLGECKLSVTQCGKPEKGRVG